MDYQDKNIEFANDILNNRKDLNSEKVIQWMNDPENVQLLNELSIFKKVISDRDFSSSRDEDYRRLEKTIKGNSGRNLRIIASIAASILLLVGLGFNHYFNAQKEDKHIYATVENTGNTKPELILPDGSRFLLDREDIEINTENVFGIFTDSLNVLDYSKVEVDNMSENEEIYNTLVVPASGFYKIKLADGTNVWLNSESELTFPVNFIGENRIVYLKGEAYFQVEKDPKRKFIVNISDYSGSVEVLGTSFNINSYMDDGNIYTTLVEGSVNFISVKNNNNIILEPGMQCKMNVENGSISAYNVDAYEVSSWKDGLFIFDSMSLDLIIKQLQRWYDFEVIFRNEEIKHHEFRGIVKRDMDLDKVLEIISETTNINFYRNENEVTIIKR